MPLNDARRKQLDEIVTKMDGGGASPDEIQAVVGDFKSKFENEVPAVDASVESKPAESTQRGGSVPPGVVGGIGAGLALGSPGVREVVKKTAGYIGHSPFAQRIAGYLGGLGGAAAAGSVAGPGAGTIGGIAGYHFVRPYAGKIARAVEAATDTAMPRVAGRFAALPAGRAAANTIFGRLIPGVGTAMAAGDVFRMLKPYLDIVGNSDAPAKAAAARAGNASIDPMVLALLDGHNVAQLPLDPRFKTGRDIELPVEGQR